MFGQRLRLAPETGRPIDAGALGSDEPDGDRSGDRQVRGGKMLPSSAVLVGLGRGLDVSLDFLMSAQIEALDAVEFRKHSGASARDRARAEAAVMDRLERYLAIERILDLEASIDWVARRRYDSVASESRIDEWADELRGVRDLGRDPIPGLYELLEDNGIKVVEADLPEEHQRAFVPHSARRRDRRRGRHGVHPGQCRAQALHGGPRARAQDHPSHRQSGDRPRGGSAGAISPNIGWRR